MSVARSSSAVAQMCSDVPPRSVLGLILFTAYVSPIGRLIELYGVSYHKYADVTHLYTARPPIQMHVSTGWSHVQLDYNDGSARMIS